MATARSKATRTGKGGKGGKGGKAGKTARTAKRAKTAKAETTEAIPQLTLHALKPPRGSVHARTRVGRGPGSGLGKTSGRGQKGQKARAGGGTRPGFEGGQMPLIRRIPKRGFTNPFKQAAQVVNVRHLGLLAEGAEVTPETLFGAGLVRRPDTPIKLLGMGEVSRQFVVKGVGVSGSARQKIEAAGGTIEGAGA